MSTLLKNFNSVTVVLFKAQFPSELPMKKELISLLDVKDVNFYKRNGLHKSDIELLEFALGCAREPIRIAYCQDFPKFQSTDVLITKPNVRSNVFVNLKYGSNLVEGFNLSGSCMDELRGMSMKYRDAVRVRLHAVNWLNHAYENIKTFQSHNIYDPSVTDLNFTKLQEFVDQYGDLGVNSVRAEIIDWLTQYCWN